MSKLDLSDVGPGRRFNTAAEKVAAQNGAFDDKVAAADDAGLLPTKENPMAKESTPFALGPMAPGQRK